MLHYYEQTSTISLVSFDSFGIRWDETKPMRSYMKYTVTLTFELNIRIASLSPEGSLRCCAATSNLKHLFRTVIVLQLLSSFCF